MWYKLAQEQRKLNNYINKKKNVPEDADLYEEKKIALLVELGELANELQFFKYWKENPKAKVYGDCPVCKGRGHVAYGGLSLECTACIGTGVDESESPVLDEYVDVVHFMLTITTDIMDDESMKQMFENVQPMHFPKITDHFGAMYYEISNGIGSRIMLVWRYVLGLAVLLEFTDEMIEAAYYKKNKENYRRQDNNY